MIDSFYDIKSMEEWLDPEGGFIYQNDAAISAFSVTPSAFGHAILFARRKGIYKETDMTDSELRLFAEAKEITEDQITYIVNRNPGHIFDLYKKWANDKDLNERTNCRESIGIVHKDLLDGVAEGDFSVFENEGEKAGQLVRHYHRQIVPRFPEDLKGFVEASRLYLHRDRIDSSLDDWAVKEKQLLESYGLDGKSRMFE